MKIVNNCRNKEITEYKVGMATMYDECIYLVVYIKKHNQYALVELDTSQIRIMADSLSELFNEHSDQGEYEVDATLIIKSISNE